MREAREGVSEAAIRKVRLRRLEPEATGDVLKDSSGNGHDGKIVGAKWVKVEPQAAPSTVGSDAEEYR